MIFTRVRALHHVGLDQRMSKRRPSIINRVQETQNFATELPVLCIDRTLQESNSVFVIFLSLLEIVQHKQIGPRRLEPTRIETYLSRSVVWREDTKE